LYCIYYILWRQNTWLYTLLQLSLLVNYKPKNNMSFSFNKLSPHLIALVVFVLIAGVYTAPVFTGKVMLQTDALMAKAAAQESTLAHEKTGNWPQWTNSMFGGMPAYMIATDYPYSIGTKLGRAVLAWLPAPTGIIVMQMLCMYILLIVMGCSSWLSIIGGIAYGFGCYTMVFIEAGHISKIIATAFAPLVLAAAYAALKGRYWTGAILMAVGMALELYANHIQITYFLAITVVIYVLWEGASMLKAGKIVPFAKAIAVLAGAGLVGAMTHSTRLLSAQQYSKESTRGRSELSISADSTIKISQNESGLNRDYAFSWSHGVGESLTLLIPGAMGGASGGGLGQNSETYKAMVAAGVDETAAASFAKEGAPLYWGPQSATAGPAYAGAIILFLFVLGLFIVKNDLKWYLLVIVALLLAFAWGSNFSVFNYPMFNYFPLFNKFRDNKMVLILMQIFLAIGAISSLKQLFENENTFENIKKPLLFSLGLTAGIALVLGLGGSMFFDFNSAADSRLEQMVGSKDLANNMVAALKTDRAALLQADGLRSVIYILLAALFLFFYTKKTLNQKTTIIAIGLLILLDLFTFNKRYLNAEDFMSKSVAEEQMVPSPANEQILLDQSPNYRVADFSSNFWSDARPSFYHKSVSGYHGAKLKRTQELFDFHIAKNNMEVLNMLNTKYFIMANEQGQPAVQQNLAANGNAWFVKNYKIVPDANAEITALTGLSTKETAIIDKHFEGQIKGLKPQFDSTNTIVLTSYSPDKLSYESIVKSEQLAIFSEIYYRGHTDWKAYIDGKEQPHLRANYVLRGMKIPSGKHTIDFVFDPPIIKTGKMLDGLASVALLLLVGLSLFYNKENQNKL
jgi:hypothetical protein